MPREFESRPSRFAAKLIAELKAAGDVDREGVLLGRLLALPSITDRYEAVKYNPNTGKPESYDWKPYGHGWSGDLVGIGLVPSDLTLTRHIPEGESRLIESQHKTLLIDHRASYIDSESYKIPATLKIRSISWL